MKPNPMARWWALGATALSLLVVGLDMTVLNVALPDIATISGGDHESHGRQHPPPGAGRVKLPRMRRPGRRGISLSSSSAESCWCA